MAGKLTRVCREETRLDLFAFALGLGAFAGVCGRFVPLGKACSSDHAMTECRENILGFSYPWRALWVFH